MPLDPSLLCSRNCGRRWSSNFGAKLCSVCLREGDRTGTRPMPLKAPTHAAAPHWQDPKDSDDEPLPF
jgi:hypothetical protein